MKAMTMRRTTSLLRHLVPDDAMADTSSADEVVETRNGALATLSLNRTSKLNSLSMNMIRLLEGMYATALKDDGVRCIVMRGEGRAFCAGGDVASVREAVLAGAGSQLPYDFFYEEYRLNNTIATMFERHGMPQIALWDGITMGGGVGLSVHGRFRVCTEKTLFAKPETKIGLFPDVGGTHVLPRVKGGMPVGRLIGLTGMRLRAADCLWSGLATHFLPSAAIPELLSRLAAMSPAEAGDAQKIDTLLLELRRDAQPDASKAELAAHEATIMRCFGADSAEGILALLDSATEDKEWAAKTAAALRSMSPMSVKLTMEGMVRSAPADVSITQALVMEYRMVQGCVLRPQPASDFYEGIRAVLVDKDNKPSYNPSRFEDVSKDAVETFFAPLPLDHPRGELQIS